MKLPGPRRAIGLVAAAIVATAAAPTNDRSGVPRFAGAPRDGERFGNLYPFKLPTLTDLARWYWNWAKAGGTKRWRAPTFRPIVSRRSGMVRCGC